MIQDEANHDVIDWTIDGKGFVIKNMQRFQF